jgi:hypothetical protein
MPPMIRPMMTSKIASSTRVKPRWDSRFFAAGGALLIGRSVFTAILGPGFHHVSELGRPRLGWPIGVAGTMPAI